jgi:phosphohistidine phosphatase
VNLLLVQHAEAKSEQEDPLRPLTDKGRQDIERVAQYLRQHLPSSPARILHSGKLRAQQTAHVLAEYLDPAGGVEVADDLDPLADPQVWAGRLTGITEDTVLVGHLPHLARLASQLVCDNAQVKVVEFQMAAVVCLGRDETGAWTVRWMITPEVV